MAAPTPLDLAVPRLPADWRPHFEAAVRACSATPYVRLTALTLACLADPATGRVPGPIDTGRLERATGLRTSQLDLALQVLKHKRFLVRPLGLAGAIRLCLPPSATPHP